MHANSVFQITALLVVCVGVLSCVQNFAQLFKEWIRVTKTGGFIIFTHRKDLWDIGDSKAKTAANELELDGKWLKIHESKLGRYMPRNPDPAERAKRIRYIVYRVR